MKAKENEFDLEYWSFAGNYDIWFILIYMILFNKHWNLPMVFYIRDPQSHDTLMKAKEDEF